MSLQYNQNVPISSISLGEQISQLPVDKIPSTPTEMNLVEHLFKKNQSTFRIICIKNICFLYIKDAKCFARSI